MKLFFISDFVFTFVYQLIKKNKTMELKLEHLSPYLPYELDLQLIIDGQVVAEETMAKISHYEWEIDTKLGIGSGKMEHIWMYKPVLRPLSQIQSYFEPLFETDEEVRDFLAQEYLGIFGIHSVEEIENVYTNYLPVGTYNLLIKHHFDVFDLIENGLATIKE